MKKSFFNKKGLIALSLTAAALVAAAGVSLAIYTNQTYQRSVVRNRDNDVIRFSSDKLHRETMQSPPRDYYYPLEEDQNTMTFQVCNFDQDRSILIHNKNIDYQITFQAVNMPTGESCTIFYGDGSSAIVTLNDETLQTTDWYSLPGGRRTVDTFKIQIPKKYDDLKIIVQVTPKKNELTQNRILSAVLIPVAYGTVQSFSVQGEFTDSEKDGLTPKDFTAYNVLVTAAGSGSAEIRWDNNKLEIDPHFLRSVLKIEDDNTVQQQILAAQNAGSITIPMNSMDSTGSYLITFYSCGSIPENWDALKELVSVQAVEP